MLITEKPIDKDADELTLRVLDLLLSMGSKTPDDITPDLDLLDTLKTPTAISRATFVQLSEIESTLERELETLDGELAIQHDDLLAKVITLMDQSKFMLSGTGQCKEKPTRATKGIKI